MGAVESWMPSNRVGHAPEEPGAPEGEEEAEEVAGAVIEEGEERENARPTTSQGHIVLGRGTPRLSSYSDLLLMPTSSSQGRGSRHP